MEDVLTGLELPGFRFHPTEEELLDFYLKNKIYGKGMNFEIIGFLNIYRHDPWDLPGLAKIGEREWYFFVPRNKKHGNGGRPNRTTERGFWKATGSDKKITKLSDHKLIGLRKTLVFYQGRAPGGKRTDWIMNEYRLPDSLNLPKDMVLCKIYRKATSLKVMEERAESMMTLSTSPPSSFSPTDAISFAGTFWEESITSSYPRGLPLMKFVEEINVEDHTDEFDHMFRGTSSSTVTSLSGKEDFGEVPMNSFAMHWPQESRQYLDSAYRS